MNLKVCSSPARRRSARIADETVLHAVRRHLADRDAINLYLPFELARVVSLTIGILERDAPFAVRRCGKRGGNGASLRADLRIMRPGSSHIPRLVVVERASVRAHVARAGVLPLVKRPALRSVFEAAVREGVLDIIRDDDMRECKRRAKGAVASVRVERQPVQADLDGLRGVFLHHERRLRRRREPERVAVRLERHPARQQVTSDRLGIHARDMADRSAPLRGEVQALRDIVCGERHVGDFQPGGRAIQTQHARRSPYDGVRKRHRVRDVERGVQRHRPRTEPPSMLQVRGSGKELEPARQVARLGIDVEAVRPRHRHAAVAAVRRQHRVVEPQPADDMKARVRERDSPCAHGELAELVPDLAEHRVVVDRRDAHAVQMQLCSRGR